MSIVKLTDNPIGTTFKEGNYLLSVKEKGKPSCKGCFYDKRRKNDTRLYGGACYLHGHACTPINRADRKHVVFEIVNK